jgi:STE24 endopeptidase
VPDLTPAAAAQAWLERLPLAQRAAAAACTESRTWGWCLGWAVVFGVCWLVLKQGWLARLRERIERDSPRPWLASSLTAGAFTALLLAVKGPFDAANAWRCDSLLHGAGGASFGAHLISALGGAASLVIAAMLLVPPAQWVVRRRLRSWPFLVGAPAICLCLALGWLPYALATGPGLPVAPANPARDGLIALIRETGLPTDQIYFSPAAKEGLDITGGFGRARVVLGPAMQAAPKSEVRAIAGHLMGHYFHGDIFSIYLHVGLLTLAACLALQWGVRPLARALGASKVEGPADPEGLPAAAIIVAAALLFAGLVNGAFIRWINVRADAFSLDHAREPDGLAAVLEREWDHQAVAPSPLAEMIFYTHPPLIRRLTQAMEWKAAQPR